MAGVTVPVVSPNAYANDEDLTNFWKAPDSAERANYLLKLSSNRLRLIAEDSGIDLDAKANASPAYFDTLQWVVMESTKRALQAPLDQQPVESFQQTAGPYSENLKYTNPTGDLWFKKSELSAIGLNGNPQLYSISTSRTDIYGS
jgi:hypothetical protein